MAQTRRKLIGQILKERGHVHEGHVQEALSVQRAKGGLIGKILVDLGRLTTAQLQLALGVQQGFEVVDLDQVEFEARFAGNDVRRHRTGARGVIKFHRFPFMNGEW